MLKVNSKKIYFYVIGISLVLGSQIIFDPSKHVLAQENPKTAESDFKQSAAGSVNNLVDIFFKYTYDEEKFFFDKKIWFKEPFRKKTVKIFADFLCLDESVSKNFCSKEKRARIKELIRERINLNLDNPGLERMNINKTAEHLQHIVDQFQKTKDLSLLNNEMFKTEIAREYLAGKYNYQMNASDVAKIIKQFVELLSKNFREKFLVEEGNDKMLDAWQTCNQFNESVEDLNKSIQQKKNHAFISDDARNEIDQLISDYQISNEQVRAMLRKGKIQQAIWFLKENLGDEISLNQAKQLEDKVIEVIQSNNVLEEKNLGGGVNETILLKFPYGIKVVYKRFVWNSFTTNYKNEISAYAVDKIFDLNFVPITVELKRKDSYGSAQFFVPDTKSARDLNDLVKKSFWEKHLPKHLAKIFIRPNGNRTQHPAYMVFFDWLIGNTDRNIDNYLYDNETNKLVGIDHGWSMHTLYTSIEPNKNQLEAIKQLDKKVIDRIKNINRDEFFELTKINGLKVNTKEKLKKVWKRILFLKQLFNEERH